MIQLDELLKIMVELEGSDLHLKPMRPPLLRKDGMLKPLRTEPLKPDQIEETLLSFLKDRHKEELEKNCAVDVGYSVPGLSRFRSHIFLQRGTYAAVFRRIPFEIPSLDDWGLPPILKEFTKLHQGLVLVTGPTGSGKSSTLASVIREVNETRPCHIITVEDPIEFAFRDKKAAVTQREIGMDTPSFQQALRNALRQDPDIILVGEMRDLATIETAITAAETGHLVFSTLHTNSAAQSIDRILDAFPASQQKQVRMQLSQILVAVISMKLVPRKGGGRCAALEICRNSPMISKMIAENRISEIEEEMANSVSYFKMQTMNQSLIALIINGQLDQETALGVSPKPEELDLQLRKIMYAATKDEEGEDMPNNSDFSMIDDLLESKRLYTELQDKFAFEVESRENRMKEMKQQMDEMNHKLQQAFKQLDRLLKEKEEATAEKEKVQQFYEKKMQQLRKQFQERLAQSK